VYLFLIVSLVVSTSVIDCLLSLVVYQVGQQLLLTRIYKLFIFCVFSYWMVAFLLQVSVS